MREISPMFAQALQHHRSGHLHESEQLYRKILEIVPRHADSLHLLGVIAFQRGRHDLAIDLIGKAIGIKTTESTFHSSQGHAFRESGRLTEAVACYFRAVELTPDDPGTNSNLGNGFREQGRLNEATVCHRRALDIDPNNPETHYNLGNALRDQERLDEAAVCYRSTLSMKPYHSGALNNLGLALKGLGRVEEAIACFRRGLTFTPDNPLLHDNLARGLLTEGIFLEGWREYEWRWSTPGLSGVRRNFTQPQWYGETASGKTLLIHAEQGFGDSLQFCRYASLVAARGLRVIMEVPLPLVGLFNSLAGVDLVIGCGEKLPDFDFHCPMQSLPLAMGTNMATIPCPTSYLQADEASVSAWRQRLATYSDRKPRIGLAWAGNARPHIPAFFAFNQRRSIAPEKLASLFDLPGLHFFSLQKDGPAAPPQFPLINFMDEIGDFAETAALISNLDLIISVDTAIAHLAAALGKPVWVLNCFDSCWRWLRQREDSPWYSSLRLFRQTSAGDWGDVIERVRQELTRYVSSPTKPSRHKVAGSGVNF
jgi:tetratricopeptide (TPR) repeat protein